MKSKLYEEMVKIAKANVDDFDENNPNHLEAMTKAFVLSNYDNKEMRESFLVEVIENAYRERVKRFLASGKYTRSKEIEAEQKILELDREIVERRAKVLKEFMD